MQGSQQSPASAVASHRHLLQPGYRQSYSGSESTSSTENLTSEEKHVLRHSTRQEPQGQEQQKYDFSLDDSSILSRLGFHFDSKLSNPNLSTIDERVPSLDYYANMADSKGTGDITEGRKPPSYSSRGGYKGSASPEQTKVAQHVTTGNKVQSASAQSLSPGSTISPSGGSQEQLKPPLYGTTVAQPASGSLEYLKPGLYASSVMPSGGSQEHLRLPLYGDTVTFSSEPQDTLKFPQYGSDSDSQEHLKVPPYYGVSTLPSDTFYLPPYHSSLGHNKLKYTDDHFAELPPPPEYQFPIDEQQTASVAKETMPGGGSKEELTTAGTTQTDRQAVTPDKSSSNRLGTKQNAEALAERASKMLDLLSEENASLRHEIEHYYRKVTKLQKFELEIQRLHEGHEALVRSSEKREMLEKAVRLKLEAEIRRLKQRNMELKDQLDVATAQLSKRQAHEIDDSELRKELSKRDTIIAQLITQNKELMATKERQEIELAAQRATLSEQRTHIDILDSALNNTQTNVARLEEENRKKQIYVDRVEQLQRALSSLQQITEQREQTEQQLRTKMERELRTIRAQHEGRVSGTTNTERPIGDQESLGSLKTALKEKNEQIAALEKELTAWEEKFTEESAIRQLAIDAASMPKDAKIAGLEKTSKECEKLLAIARAEKLKQMDELYSMQRKYTALEAKMQEYKTKLAEKEAMVKVLQKHLVEKDAAAFNVMLRASHHHSPHASLLAQGASASQPDIRDVSSIASAMLESSHYMDRVESMPDSSGDTSAFSDTSYNTLIFKDSSLPSTDLPPPSPSYTLSSAVSTATTSTVISTSGQDSILAALQAEKQAYPGHYWRV